MGLSRGQGRSGPARSVPPIAEVLRKRSGLLLRSGPLYLGEHGELPSKDLLPAPHIVECPDESNEPAGPLATLLHLRPALLAACSPRRGTRRDRDRQQPGQRACHGSVAAPIADEGTRRASRRARLWSGIEHVLPTRRGGDPSPRRSGGNSHGPGVPRCAARTHFSCTFVAAQVLLLSRVQSPSPPRPPCRTHH
jgi:hypothetical protein